MSVAALVAALCLAGSGAASTDAPLDGTPFAGLEWIMMCQGEGTPAAAGTTAPSGDPKEACRTGVRGVTADELIAVARDISSDLAATLVAARAKDATAFAAAAKAAPRRLSSLAVLKARKPALYALRIEEIRVQGELEDLSRHWASARLGARTSEAASLETRVRALSGTLVDLNLRSRAMELAELEAVMRSMRTDLERDSRGRDDSVGSVIAACRDGQEARVLGGRAPVAGGPAPPPAPATPSPTPPPTPVPGADPARPSPANPR